MGVVNLLTQESESASDKKQGLRISGFSTQPERYDPDPVFRCRAKLSSDLSYSYDQKAAADPTLHRALLRTDLGHAVHILVHL